MTRRVLAAGGLLALATLTGCSSDTESYCGVLEERQQELTALADRVDQPDVDIFGESLTIFEDLQDAAPGDVRDEWDTLVFAWQGLADAFDDAGTTPQEFNPSAPPADMDPAEVSALQDAAAELASQRVIDAGDGIEQHAKDVCKVDLGL